VGLNEQNSDPDGQLITLTSSSIVVDGSQLSDDIHDMVLDDLGRILQQLALKGGQQHRIPRKSVPIVPVPITIGVGSGEYSNWHRFLLD
jgi:hypothetical protein